MPQGREKKKERKREKREREERKKERKKERRKGRKINELSSYEKTWKNLKYLFSSERSQSEKATYHIIPNT